MGKGDGGSTGGPLGPPLRTPPARCPHCGYAVTAASSVSGPDATPKPGDFTVCINCGEVAAFTPSLTLRRLTKPELKEAAADRFVALTQRAVAKLNRTHGPLTREH